MIYEDCSLRYLPGLIPAQISIENDVLSVIAGQWPGCGVEVAAVSGYTLEPADAFVYLDHDGGIVVATEDLLYRPTPLDRATMLDLLAWREDGEWHIKRLVHDA